jgi:8-oxo-dGTP pyrophosphatase MutT (NUDIX family)
VSNKELEAIVDAYFAIFPEEQGKLDLLRRQLADDEKLDSRKNFRGHITGAAIVLSPDKSKLLVVHHKFLDDWFQPGGHWEGDDPDPWTAACREVEEETSVEIAKLLPIASDDPHILLDIETHPYKARPEKYEPTHFHHDFRYVFLAKNEHLSPLKAEVKASAWVPFGDARLKNMQPVVAKLQRFTSFG